MDRRKRDSYTSKTKHNKSDSKNNNVNLCDRDLVR